MKFISYRTLRSMCLDLIIFLVLIAVSIFLIPYVFKLFAPFIAGFFLYLAAKPLNLFFMKRRLPSSLCALFSLMVISAVLFFIIRIAGQRIFAELRSFTQNPPIIYSDTINSALHKFNAAATRVKFSGFSLSSVTPGLLDVFEKKLGEIISAISSFLLNFAKEIPSILIASFAAIFTAYFLLKENNIIFPFFKNFIGEKLWNKFLRLKNTLFSVMASYIKAQLIIEGIIFIIVLSGFFILKVKYAFILALLTAIVDAVPILGTGTVLIPMALFNFLSSNNALSWGTIILYGITLISRQLCEPKILGKSLGIHPLATVFSLYAGMKFFGLPGLIFGPFVAILVKILIFPEKNTNKCLHF